MLGGIGAKLKGAAVKTALKTQLKKLPKDQREMLEALMEHNPELLMKMAEETQELVKGGKDQMVAMMEVGRKYQKELQEALMQFKK